MSRAGTKGPFKQTATSRASYETIASKFDRHYAASLRIARKALEARRRLALITPPAAAAASPSLYYIRMHSHLHLKHISSSLSS
jgi:hypothetical protein